MKLVGRSGSRDGNRAQTQKSAIREHELSDAPYDEDIYRVTDIPHSDVDISDLSDVMQLLEQQQPEFNRPVVKESDEAAGVEAGTQDEAVAPVVSATSDMPKAPAAPKPVKTNAPATPLITSYPDSELSPAQKAAIQRVISKEDKLPEQTQISEQSPRSENLHGPGKSQKSGKMQEAGKMQGSAPVQRKAKKKKRADIHAYSDRQLKKKGPPVKVIIIILILVVVLAGGGLFGWYYWETEHATFEYDLRPVVILNGQSVEAHDFLSETGEMEHVIATFQNPGFKPQIGLQHVPLTLHLGLRTVEASTTLHVMTTVDMVTHEYKEPGHDLRAIDFISNLGAAAGNLFDVHFVETPKNPEEYEVGEHKLFLTLNGAPFESLLVVADTTPPTAIGVTKHIRAGETVIPTDFVDDYYDHSGIRSIEWIEAPHLATDHDQIVEILITDNHGNSAIFKGELLITLNEYPPIIEGADTIISALGAPILYRDGVTAFDDMGRDLTDIIQVDISGVDQFKVGVYTVTYFVEDATGLTDEVEITVHIIDVDFDWLFERIDTALESIRSGIRGNEVTQLDMVRGIHTWIGRTLRSSTEGEKYEIDYAGAYRALRDGRGNYHNYSSLAAVMLDRAGIENMLISRTSEAPTSFRWNLVNPDDKGWHHFDAFPPRILIGSEGAFFTETKAKEFTKRYNDGHNIKDYYVYDADLFTDIVIVE